MLSHVCRQSAVDSFLVFRLRQELRGRGIKERAWNSIFMGRVKNGMLCVYMSRMSAVKVVLFREF